MAKARLPRDWTKNKLNLTLSNGELDFFEAFVKETTTYSESMYHHIQEQIDKARRSN